MIRRSCAGRPPVTCRRSLAPTCRNPPSRPCAGPPWPTFRRPGRRTGVPERPGTPMAERRWAGVPEGRGTGAAGVPDDPECRTSRSHEGRPVRGAQGDGAVRVKRNRLRLQYLAPARSRPLEHLHAGLPAPAPHLPRRSGHLTPVTSPSLCDHTPCHPGRNAPRSLPYGPRSLPRPPSVLLCKHADTVQPLDGRRPEQLSLEFTSWT